MQHLSALGVLFFLPFVSFAQAAHPDTTTLPAGTQLPLVVIRPVWAASTKPGDPLYAQTTFPVALGNAIAIPGGSYVLGEIDSVVRPTRKSNHATLTIHLTQIIFAGSYAVPLSSTSTQAILEIQSSPANDLLLDNGAQFEIALTAPLTLDAARIATAVSLSTPVKPGQFTSATLCRPIAAVDGSPDTVISGTPGFPGTPDIVIPGADGAPPTVIPGTPATPGTPPSVIPGSPSSPGYACPAPPLVLSSNNLSASTPPNPTHP